MGAEVFVLFQASVADVDEWMNFVSDASNALNAAFKYNLQSTHASM